MKLDAHCLDRWAGPVLTWLALACLLLAVLLPNPEPPRPWSWVTFEPRRGDTLWALSGWLCDGRSDRRAWLYRVRQANGRERVEPLVPGRKVVLPDWSGQ